MRSLPDLVLKLMSLARWIKVVVALRLQHSEAITIDSPLLVRMKKGKIVPMTADFMARKDKVYGPILKWNTPGNHEGYGRCEINSSCVS